MRFFCRIYLCLSVVACASSPKTEIALTEDADSDLGHWHSISSRTVAAETDRREAYQHGGAHNFNPATPNGSVAIETNDIKNFRQDLSDFKDPKATSENYEYQTNREDIVARHTFVLAGSDRSIGHHVAFFESRHQHHALVKLEFNFTGDGIKPGTVNVADLKAGQILFEEKIKKEGLNSSPALPAGEFYAVQVSPLNPEFELVTIPTGITRTFLGSFATINSSGKVSRFNAKGSDVAVKITGLYHFSRMYVKESEESLQYMAFSAKNPNNKNRLVLAHIIRGSLPQRDSNDALNLEQMIEADVVAPTGFELKDGSIVQVENRNVDSLLKPNDEIEVRLLKDGSNEIAPQGVRALKKLRVGKVVYSRAFGIDAGQDAIRKRVRGE